MAEDLRYEMNLEYQQFLNGSRKSTKALVDIEKASKSTDKGLSDLYNTGVLVGGGMTKTSRGVNTATKSFKAMRGATSQLSFQLQDIAVQAQMGTDAFIILGQQGPQIASIFGAGGAVVGSLIAFGSLLAGVLVNGASAATDSLDEMIEKVDELGDAEKRLLQIKLQDKIREISNASLEADAKVSVLNGQLQEQEIILRKLQSGTAEGWLTDILLSADDVKGKISEISKELIIAEGATGKLNRESSKYRELLDGLSQGAIGQSEGIKTARSEFDSLSTSLALQIELLGKTEREQAKVAAAHQLGAERTKVQTDAVNLLIDAYFNELDIITRRKDAEAAAAKETKKNEQLLVSLSNAYEVAKLKSAGYAEQAFILAQTQKLGANATAEQIKKTEELSAKLFEAQQIQKEGQGQAFLDRLLEQQATELELIGIHEQAKLDQAMEFYLQGQLTYQQYQDSLTAIGEQAADARIALDRKESQMKLSAFSSMFGNLSSLMNTESRKMFEIGKTAAIADTIISTYSSAQKSYDAMASIPYIGPALGAAAAAAAIAGGLARVSAISSQSFSRGSPSDAGQSIPSQPSSPQAQQTQANQLNINLTGVTDSKFGQLLAETLNDSIAEGTQIMVNQ